MSDEPPRTGRSERSEFVRGPRWRVEAAPEKRRNGALITVAILFAIGLAVMLAAMVVLDAVGAAGWLVAAPWVLPTIGAVVWTLVRPRPAIASNDDESWVTYATLHVLVGPDEPRSTPARVVVAVVLGGPIAWALGVFWLLAVVGLVDA